MCGILAIIVAFTPILYAFFHKCFELAFSCISAISIAPVWFLYLEALLPGYDAYEYTPAVYRLEMFFWVAVFQIFICLIYLLLWKRMTKLSVKSFSFLKGYKINPVMFGILTILAFVIPLLGFYYYYESTEKLWVHLTAGRSEEGTALKAESVNAVGGAYLKPLTWLLQLTPLFGAVTVVAVKRWFNPLALIAIALSALAIFIFFLSGSRGTTMFVAAPIFFFLVYYNWQKGLKFWIPMGAALLMMIAVMEMQVRFRGNLLDVIKDPEKAAKENYMESVTTFDPSKSHRDNNTYLFCLILKGYPDKYEFRGFSGLVASLVNPIPRAIWPSKPVMAGAQDISTQPQWVRDGPLFMGTTSLTYSVVGDAYQAQGILGLLVYASIFAVFLIYFDGIVFYTKERQPLAAGLLGVGVFLAFWGYRSLFALITFLYPILLLLAFIYIIQLLRKVIAA